MALSKGKKILIAVVAGVVAIGTTIGVVLGIQNSKDPGPDIPSIDTPVAPNPDTPVDPTPDDPVDPTPDDPVDPTPDDPVDPDPDTPVDPDPGEEEPETPEISEEDYRIQNVEVLKEILAKEYDEFSKIEGLSYKLENIEDIIINSAAGEVYFTADVRRIAHDTIDVGLIEGCNFTGYLGQSFDWQSQEELNKFLTSFNESDGDMKFDDYKSAMSSQVSEGKYDEFIDFVKKQSYDGVDLSSIPNENFFGVTWFILDNDAYGYSYVEYNAINNGNVYTIHLENVKPTGAGDRCITELMSYSNSVFKIVDVQPFEEFDIDTEIRATAQAQSEFFLDLSEVAIPKDQAQDLANAIRASNPKKLGNMEVKLPAENPDFEL